MLQYGALPEMLDMKRSGKSDEELMRRVLEIADLIILRDVLRLQKIIPSSYEIDPTEAEKTFNILAYRSPSIFSINSLAEDVSLHWGKTELAIKLFEASGVLSLARNYSREPSRIARRRLFKGFVTDVSFRNAFRMRLGRKLLASPEDIGLSFENAVLTQCLKLAYFSGDSNLKI